MTAAIASLIGLLVAIVMSMVSRINVGVVAVAAAWIVFTRRRFSALDDERSVLQPSATL